jgi:hypothetical protein
VFAGKGEPYAEGSLPVNATCDLHGHADVCTMVSKNVGIPFRIALVISQRCSPGSVNSVN